jgi:hypothetical protein
MDRCKSHVIAFKTSLSIENDYTCTAFLTGLVHETKIKCDKAKGYRKNEKVTKTIKVITQDDSLSQSHKDVTKRSLKSSPLSLPKQIVKRYYLL